MTIILNSAAPGALFEQLHDQIVAAIARGELTPGTKLNSVRSVAMEFGINPATVKKAYDQLAAEGFVITRPRAGTVVANPGHFSPEQARALKDSITAAFTLGRAQGATDEQLRELAAAALRATPGSANTCTQEVSC